jgi:hypothetical protein
MNFLMLLPAVAGATEGLAWQWTAHLPLTWALTAEVRLPQVWSFNAEENKDARISMFRFDSIIRCTTAEPAGKGKYELGCQAVDVRIAAAPLQADVGSLPGILDEYDGLLLTHPIRLLVTDDGKVKTVDIDGISHNDKTVVIEETLRLMLVRQFALIDLQLPKKGDDGGRKWKQSLGLAYQFPDIHGTMGIATTDHVVASTEGSVVEIVSRGRGLVGSGEMIDVGGKEQPQQMYDAVLEGTARFDTARGLMLERKYLVRMDPKSSTAMINEWQAIPYVQAASMVLIDVGQMAAPLPPNIELPVSIGPEDAAN